MLPQFEGKVVIVTGAGSGIGAATANRLYAEGATVVLNGRREFKLIEVGAALDNDRYMIRPGDVSICSRRGASEFGLPNYHLHRHDDASL